MQKICLYFQIHQPYRLKRYRFFDIGKDNQYFDESTNKNILQNIAKKCYLPANKLLLNIIKKYKDKFKISFSISGIALEQFEEYAPSVIDSFKELTKTGCVEFLSETNSHSLISVLNKEDFIIQVKNHTNKIESLFGQKPKVFRNTELIYNNNIGEIIADLGFKAILSEGADRILSWRSPNLLYYNVLKPELKILLKNYKLSDDIAFRFSDKSWGEYPLTANKYVEWLKKTDKNDDVINLFLDYETFGEHHSKETGIFTFLKNFPKIVFKNSDFEFSTPSEIAESCQPIAPLNITNTTSWADEDRDLSAWLGNELQNEAFEKLYELASKINKINDPKLDKTWKYLQSSDHFYYMCTKSFADGIVHNYFNPYNSPYEAFINYMNVLSDFKIRVDTKYEETKPKINKQILKQIEKLRAKLYEPDDQEKNTQHVPTDLLKTVKKVEQDTKIAVVSYLN